MVNTCEVKVGGYLEDQQLCADCFDVIGPTRKIPAGRGTGDEGNINPWQDNAIRSLEEDR
jgi:hypothetical protein